MSESWPKLENEEFEENSGYDDCNFSTEDKCRLCLKDDDVLIPVYSGENLEGSAVSSVALKIDILTTVKVAPTDKICTVCRLKIKRFYSFRVMCLRSDARIKHASVRSDVPIFRPGPSEPVRSYKKQKRIQSSDSHDAQNQLGNNSLSIIPMSQSDCVNMKAETKLSSGLTISAVPMKRESGNNENGHKLDYDNVYEDNSTSPGLGDTAEQDCSSSHGEETENLEVQIDPFMLMEDDTSDQDQHSPVNSMVNVRGHILYPVLGNNVELPPLQPGPHRPGPLAPGKSSDRERAIELIKQMTSTRTKSSTSSIDGSFLDKPFKCDVCPESFSYYKSFVKHKQRHTGELEPVKCEFCPDVFQTSRQLQNHLKYHNVEKAFPCDQCERSFPTKERLQSHYTLHTGNKPYVCEICNKSFAYKSSYGLHIRKQHGEQPIKSQSFKCDKCYQEFDIFVDFKNHLRTHVGEKPFTCNVCEKAFASKSILNVHSRIHNGLRPYKCDTCGQTFTQKQSLDYHMRRHNDENPFKCEHCGMTFQRRYFLEKHKETQHGAALSNQGVAVQQSEVEQPRNSVMESMDGEDDSGRIKHEEQDEDEEDDDMDSDPLKLEIDETSDRVESDGGQDGQSTSNELSL